MAPVDRQGSTPECREVLWYGELMPCCCRHHCVGLNRVGPLVEQPISEVQEVFETNVMGVLRMTQVRRLLLLLHRHTGM